MTDSDGRRYVIVRQRAGYMVKAFVTDNYSYLERYGRRAAAKRCRPAFSRTSVDRLELRLALFGFDGIFYTLTFDKDNVPPDWAGVKKAWERFLKRLKRCRGSPVDYYVYRIEGLHGGHRWHLHVFLRQQDFSSAEVQQAWDGQGEIWAETWNRARVLATSDVDFRGYRGLATYITKEVPEVGRHPWGCSRSLSKHIPPPTVTPSSTGAIRPPPGAVPMLSEEKSCPRLGSWGVYGYSRYLLPES